MFNLHPTVIQLATFFGGVLSPVAIYLGKKWIDNKFEKNSDKIAKEAEFSSLIDHKLDRLRNDYKADRIWLCQFHNGGHFYPTGKSIQKFSMFYESVSVNVSSIKFQYQNIPINLFSKTINELLSNDIVSIPEFYNPNINDFGLKYIIEDDTKSLYIVAIRDLEGRFIGMLGMSFSKRKTNLIQVDLMEFMMEASRMGGELIKHLKTK